MDGVTKEVPVPKEEPPVEAAYQLTTAPYEFRVVTVTAKVTEPASQREAAVPEAIVGVAVTIVAITEVLAVEELQLELVDARA